MDDNDQKTVFRRIGTISQSSALAIARKNLRLSHKKCETDNPDFITTEVKNKLKEFTFVVCGAPRTGKSTLVNAIINQEVALVKPGPAPVTLETTCYKREGTFPDIIDEQTGEKQQDAQAFQINIWDTKGIKTWDTSICDIIREKNPMCVILCSSPGAFANDEFVRQLIQECVNFNIFIALVCTNQWNDSDEKRAMVMEEFHNLMKVYNTNFEDDNGIRYYGNIGLITMVNSVPYTNTRIGIYKPKSGIGSLLYGIMKSLDDDKLLGWCYTLMENDGFWSQMQTQIQDYFAGKFIYGKSILWSLSRGMSWLRK